MPKPIIFFDNVDLSYEVNPVLKNISLQINEGEHSAILGANGSGKSTLIKLINCELYPSYKNESFHREILGNERWIVSQLRKHLGVVTNDLHTRFLFEGGHLSGFEAVISGFFGTLGLFKHLEISSTQIDAAMNAMMRLGIEHLKEKRLSQMSMGELRKCIVARALVHPVKAILLDEPTVGLDVKAQLDFITMMRNLANGGTTVILVTHHIEEVFEEIQKTVLIKDGMIYAAGEKVDIINSYNLSAIFNTPLKVISEQGRYSVRHIKKGSI
ncbi:MAG: ATP-binding cassette domain-containing protein [Sulfurovaceae bacterium]|nr:ATP-binding cassette domain-containing protein [Sulfurovaceae bacterium]